MGGTDPAVVGKEVQSVTLLQLRSVFQRLDVGPFVFLYSTVLAFLLQHAKNQAWHRVTLFGYGIGVIFVGQVLLHLFTHWSVHVKSIVTSFPVFDVLHANRVKVVPSKFKGKAEIVTLDKRQLVDGSEEVSFEFRKHKFIFNTETNTFEKLKYPVKEKFEYYLKASGHGKEDKVASAVEKWGLNRFEVPLPPFIDLLKEQMLAPFFCFQVFCVGLWCIDEYWYYSIFTLFMLVTFECTVVGQRLKNLKDLRSLQTPKQRLHVYRGGKWDLVPGEALLPNDIISIGRPSGEGAEEQVVPADCLLLAGNCIVEEAVLTGESTPQWKVPVEDVDPAEHLNMKSDKQHILFGGTKILQHTGDKAAKIRTPDGGCLAMVLRTGFETAQGRLMRTILYSTERMTANNVETGVFIAFLLVFAVSAAAYVLKNGLDDPNRDRFKLLLNCVMIITSVIPPELPMELTIAVNTSLVALAKKKVFCTEPFRIPFAGKVEVCCFDKTGTLTTDHLLLEGVAGVEGRGKELVADLKEVPARVAQLLGSCHALVQVDDKLIGDPLEKAAIDAVGWTYNNDVALSPDKKTKVTLLHRYHFSSTLKRMGAVVRVEEPTTNQISHLVLLKGAPEQVKLFLDEVTSEYDEVYKHYAAQGARVIALAYRELPESLDSSTLRTLSQKDAEQHLKFCGFAVFQCPLKEESEPSLKALSESRHQLMMITGDAPLTACHAAGQVHIVTRDVLILSHKNEGSGEAAPHLHHGHIVEDMSDSSHDREYQWVSPNDKVVIPFSRNWLDILQLAAEYDLCLTGDGLAYVEAVGLASKVIPLCQVYARVSPEQKELVLVTLRSVGRITLMCGDGTNDVGGLKAAHVGVALLAPSDLAEKVKKFREAHDRKAPGPRNRANGTPSGAAESTSSRTSKVRSSRVSEKKRPGTEMLDKLRERGQAVSPAMESMAQWMDKLEDDSAEPPMLKPGDASMASPFTAKAASVQPCTDILKQGRCTLVTTVQMFKILGLLCLSTAYSLSVMYLQGVKLSDIQATLSGVLTAGMFFFISSAKPLEKLSAQRPHPSIFNPYFFLSLLGQFAVHMTFLIYMYRQSLALMPPEESQTSDSEFKPNLVNSVCYLVQQVIQLMTFAVNYVGPPFNTPLMENQGMRKSLSYSSLFLLAVTLELFPGMNEWFGLVPIPMHLRLQLVAGTLIALTSTFRWEQILRHMFPPPTPPQKGYMMHRRDLAAMQSRKDKNA